MTTTTVAPATPVFGPQLPNIRERITHALTTYVAFPDPAQELVLSYWALHTHAVEGAYATPYIYVNSPEKQCGKTLTIDVLSYLVRNSAPSSQITASTLFRIMGDGTTRPTIFIDEADALFTGAANEDLRGILNSGYKRNGCVWRTLPGRNDDGSDVVKFPTFCPKLLAGIDNGKLPDTIADRCITITLRRARKDQTIKRLLPRKVEPIMDALKVDIETWVRGHAESIFDAEPDTIEEISARAFEITEPLLQLAHVLGETDMLRAAIIKLMSAPIADSPQTTVLRTAHGLFTEAGTDRISSAALATATGLNGKAVGELLKPHGIKPGTYRIGGRNAKGYMRAQFEDAFSRYLS